MAEQRETRLGWGEGWMLPRYSGFPQHCQPHRGRQHGAERCAKQARRKRRDTQAFATPPPHRQVEPRRFFPTAVHVSPLPCAGGVSGSACHMAVASSVKKRGVAVVAERG